jgi:hypothetical protein
MKKAQWRILPIFFLSCLIAYIDRVNSGFAAETMNADLGFSATVYDIGAGMFFASDATLEIPSLVLMQRFGPRRDFIPRHMVPGEMARPRRQPLLCRRASGVCRHGADLGAHPRAGWHLRPLRMVLIEGLLRCLWAVWCSP